MAIRVAINGFGRIGRNILRSGWNHPDIEFVHINDLTSPDMLAYLLRRDSVHGTWREQTVEAVEGAISVGGTHIPTSAEKDPSNLPWKDLGVDVVLECTGVFTDGQKAKAHLDAGARKVLISAPGKNVDATFVKGVNDDAYDPSRHHVVSNASCTTNCLAPLAKVVHDTVGIERGLMTTVHSYTMDQNLLDGPHKKFRRARAAAVNMVPTSTGAALAIGLVLPELDGRLDGVAIRVPTPNVSIVDLTFEAKRSFTSQELNQAFHEAAQGPLRGILHAETEEIVSSDVNTDSHSAVVDVGLTNVIDGKLGKVFAWYDNEWGFSRRMVDMAAVIGRGA